MIMQLTKKVYYHTKMRSMQKQEVKNPLKSCLSLPHFAFQPIRMRDGARSEGTRLSKPFKYLDLFINKEGQAPSSRAH